MINEMHAPPHERWFRVDEVAKELRISETLVRRLIREGTIEHRRFGRIIRVPSSALGAPLPETAR